MNYLQCVLVHVGLLTAPLWSSFGSDAADVKIARFHVDDLPVGAACERLYQDLRVKAPDAVRCFTLLVIDDAQSAARVTMKLSDVTFFAVLQTIGEVGFGTIERRDGLLILNASKWKESVPITLRIPEFEALAGINVNDSTSGAEAKNVLRSRGVIVDSIEIGTSVGLVRIVGDSDTIDVLRAFSEYLKRASGANRE